MKTARPILFTALSIVLLAHLNVTAQERSPQQKGCVLIDDTRPSQFVSYDAGSQSTAHITLRLYNNTSCGIVVETDDTVPTRFTRLPNGGAKFETVTGSQDGVRLRLHYLIQDTRRRGEPETAYGWGDSVYHYEIMGGHSATFSVPLVHFRRRFDIAVPFKYAWEGQGAIGRGPGTVIHRVYFLFKALPKGLLRR